MADRSVSALEQGRQRSTQGGAGGVYRPEVYREPYLVGQEVRYATVCSCYIVFTLVAYMYRGGFARFSHTRYSSDPADIANNFVHLTNGHSKNGGEL